MFAFSPGTACAQPSQKQSALPIDASGLRSADSVSAFTRYFRLAPFQQLHISFGTAPSNCPLPQERQQPFSDGGSDLPLHPAEHLLLKLASSASRRGGQESIPRVLVAAAEVTTSLGPGQSGMRGADSNRHRSGRLILLPLRTDAGIDVYLSRMCLLLRHPWCISLREEPSG